MAVAAVSKAAQMVMILKVKGLYFKGCKVMITSCNLVWSVIQWNLRTLISWAQPSLVKVLLPLRMGQLVTDGWGSWKVKSNIASVRCWHSLIAGCLEDRFLYKSGLIVRIILLFWCLKISLAMYLETHLSGSTEF